MRDGARNGALADSRAKVGTAIRQKRVAAGLSLAQLAEKVGVAISTMSKIENGKLSTSFERLENVARALSADLAELVGEGAVSFAAASPPPFGTRRSITEPGGGTLVDAGGYLEWFLAADLLNKRFQPIVAEIIVEDVADYGPFTQHSGEEFNYVLEGELEFHTEVYAPVRLKAGASIYFDAEMKHAHVKIGSERCRIVGILCPRSENAAAASEPRRSMHLSGANDTMPTPKAG